MGGNEKDGNQQGMNACPFHHFGLNGAHTYGLSSK